MDKKDAEKTLAKLRRALDESEASRPAIEKNRTICTWRAEYLEKQIQGAAYHLADADPAEGATQQERETELNTVRQEIAQADNDLAALDGRRAELNEQIKQAEIELKITEKRLTELEYVLLLREIIHRRLEIEELSDRCAETLKVTQQKVYALRAAGIPSDVYTLPLGSDQVKDKSVLAKIAELEAAL